MLIGTFKLKVVPSPTAIAVGEKSKSAMPHVSVESIVFRSAEMNSNFPDAG